MLSLIRGLILSNKKVLFTKSKFPLKSNQTDYHVPICNGIFQGKSEDKKCLSIQTLLSLVKVFLLIVSVRRKL